MKKLLFKRYVQVIMLCVPGLFALVAEAQISIPSFLSSNSVAPKPEAKSWVLMENETGWVLAANNEHNKVDPASLTKLMRARTCFVIAHRLSTIAHADRIVVLESGRISEMGTHDALIASEGKYRDMLVLQTSPAVVG